ncbi:MAG: flavin reductase family protein [Pseudomonadota bacterium]
MSFDQRTFRDALSTFVTGVTVVTTCSETGDFAGITANSFNSVSLDPPLILWSLGRDSGSFSTFEAATHFAVHILSDAQTDLSQRFAAVGVDKFAGLQTKMNVDGVPLIDDCIARFECSVFERVPAGDHIIYIGQVERLSFDGTRSPLVYHDGKYARIEGEKSIA